MEYILDFLLAALCLSPAPRARAPVIRRNAAYFEVRTILARQLDSVGGGGEGRGGF